MKFLIALVVVIAVLAYVLHRRGSGGVSSDTEKSIEKALGQSHRGGPGGSAGLGSGGGGGM